MLDATIITTLYSSDINKVWIRTQLPRRFDVDVVVSAADADDDA